MTDAPTVAMDAHTLELLEFGKVRELLAGYSACSLGKELALQLEPLTDPAVINRELDLVGEMVIEPAGFGAAMLGAGAVGLSGEAGAAISATALRARRFVPSGSLSAFEGERAAWFDQVRPSAAVHSPGS